MNVSATGGVRGIGFVCSGCGARGLAERCLGRGREIVDVHLLWQGDRLQHVSLYLLYIHIYIMIRHLVRLKFLQNTQLYEKKL